ncbi:MAG: N-acetyl sugar amidotransferase [Verrucomicrobia bacterium]|nr:N-acetyl sugar amidotransferase [Verrucomicrobiota bacterium]
MNVKAEENQAPTMHPATFFVSPEKLQVCTKTVMDNTDPDITFDAEGVCNWFHEYQNYLAARPDEAGLAALLEETLGKIRRAGHGRPFDCILGLSGGVDSSYMAYLAKSWNLRPLVVHFDNGWNDELAVSNIEQILKRLDFKLHTFVMDWPEFRDLQRAYFKAGVVDLEVPTDHMIFGALHQIAAKHNIKYIFSGNNFATEGILPSKWIYRKGDLGNIRGIHQAFGELPMKHLPKLGVFQRMYYQKVRMIELVEILQMMPYSKLQTKELLKRELGWQDYGGKHYESVFTRFYQGCILPMRFGIDKRKAHLSNLICNGELTREDALAELAKPTYEPERHDSDRRYVAKKLGWTESEFQKILDLPVRAHQEFGTEEKSYFMAEKFIKLISPIARFRRLFLRK